MVENFTKIFGTNFFWKKKFVENKLFLQLVIFKKWLYNQKACPDFESQ
jgi:hypothetical protein